MKLPISFLLEYLEKDIRKIGDIQEHVEYLVQDQYFGPLRQFWKVAVCI